MTFLSRDEVYTAEDARKVRSEYPEKEAKRLANEILSDIRGLPYAHNLELRYGLFKGGPKSEDMEIWFLVKSKIEGMGYTVTHKSAPWWKKHLESGLTLVEW